MEIKEDHSAVCYYHNDNDGILAAHIVRKAYPSCKCIPVQYGDAWDHADVKDKIVFVVDFSFETMRSLKNACTELYWIDHHEGSKLKYTELWEGKEIKGWRAMADCGAKLTWKFLFEKQPIPKVVEYVNDWDLWKFTMGLSTHFVQQHLNLLDFDDIDWDILLAGNSSHGKRLLEDWHKDGPSLLRKIRKHCESVTSRGIEKKWEGKRTLFVNATTDISLVADYILNVINMDNDKEKYDIGIVYFDVGDKTVFSLRSRDEGDKSIDVNKIAMKYGGGGHINASGFKVDWEKTQEILR